MARELALALRSPWCMLLLMLRVGLKERVDIAGGGTAVRRGFHGEQQSGGAPRAAGAFSPGTLTPLAKADPIGMAVWRMDLSVFYHLAMGVVGGGVGGQMGGCSKLPGARTSSNAAIACSVRYVCRYLCT